MQDDVGGHQLGRAGDRQLARCRRGRPAHRRCGRRSGPRRAPRSAGPWPQRAAGQRPASQRQDQHAPATAPNAAQRDISALAQLQRLAGDQDLRVDFGVELFDRARPSPRCGGRSRSGCRRSRLRRSPGTLRFCLLRVVRRLAAVPCPPESLESAAEGAADRPRSRRRGRPTRAVTATTRAGADERLFIGRDGRSDGRRRSYIRSAAFLRGRNVPNRRCAGSPPPPPDPPPRRCRARRRPGPRRARRAKAAPSSSGRPPWAPTPGMRKIERGISERRRAMCSGAVAPTTAPIPLRPPSPSSRSREAVDQGGEALVQRLLGRRQVLHVGGAGIARPHQGEDSRRRPPPPPRPAAPGRRRRAAGWR